MKNTAYKFSILLLSIFCIAAMSAGEVQVFGPSSADRVMIHSSDKNRAVVSVLDANDKPIAGLQTTDFAVQRGSRSGKILSVSPFEVAEETPLNVVLVVDNSFSMEKRNAVQPLLGALEEFYKTIRPIDNIHAVVFDDTNTISVRGKTVNAKAFQSNDPNALRTFFNQGFSQGLSRKTYLYDGMTAGLDIISRMPEESNKFLLVFTDGEDINSAVNTAEVENIARSIPNMSAYALDFKEDTSIDFFLRNFSESNSGRIWKADFSYELIPIFQAFSNILHQQYIVTYRFLEPPTGTLALAPETVIIEEVTTIDSSPMLNYVFFEEGQSGISSDYVLYSRRNLSQNFSEDQLGAPMDKYRNIMNIIGKRLRDDPNANITILGCNSNLGIEKNNITLSRRRAESVQAYLQDIWGIEQSRMEIKARNLPQSPSASAHVAGIAENRRVEILSAHSSILDIVKTTYVQQMADAKTLSLTPKFQSEAGIAKWKVDLKSGDETVIDTASGVGDMGSAVTFNLVPAGLSRIASFKTLTASVEVIDNEGVAFKDNNAAIANVRFIKRETQTAQRRGQRILEQYALILFEYDKSDLQEHNKSVINRIVARMNELPDAEVTIVGHTDAIGSEEYNLRLSERRARAVYDQLVSSGMTSRDDLSYTGVGLRQPLYNNSEPEGRALNRTVIVTLEYDDQN